jgi:hypothetical protein
VISALALVAAAACGGSQPPGESAVAPRAAPAPAASTPAAHTAAAPGKIVAEPPARPDRAARYLFYLHGRIVQDQGRKAVSPQFGSYEYDEILRSFVSEGFVVISEVRPRGAEPSAYADRIVAQIRRLMDAGVPARNITVVGASMGGSMAMLVSSHLAARDVGYVLLGSCGEGAPTELDGSLHGDVLSIYEASDAIGRSCEAVFERSRDLGRRAEIRISTGRRHGFLYRPLPEWMAPAVRWARDRAA